MTALPRPTPLPDPLPIARPFLGPEEAAAILRPLERGWVVQGPEVAAFEAKLAAFTGAPDAVATSSCTTALHAAVTALDLGPGDEVIVPAFTWVATANVVVHAGATPVFADIDPTTFNVDPRAVAAAVTRRTVGIIPVHLFGLPAAMDELLAIARRHGLWVVEDAACGLGARIRGRHVGTFGDAGAFSFHPRKSITTGEGGALVTAGPDLARRVRSLRDHGATLSDLARHESRAGFLLPDFDEVGFNYRMTDLQGALGSVQMDRLAWILGERARLASLYEDALAGLDWLALPDEPAGMDHGWQAFVTRYRPERPSLDAPVSAPGSVARLHARRNALMDALAAEGIATRPGTHAVVLQRAYRGLVPDAAAFPNAVIADRLSLALPLFAGMTDGDIARVADALRRHGP